jgi:hypothetical protein
MRSDWVAASVRARSMAQRRVGAGTCRTIAAAPGLPAATTQLADTVYGRELKSAQTLSQTHRATRRTVLWQLRVLAGWLPAGGTRLIRAAAAAFEADNILALDLRLRRQETGISSALSPAFDLGGLATAWPRLSTAATDEELRAALASSPWGDPGPETALADILTLVWVRRLAAEAAAVRPWAAAAVALIAARLVLVEGTAPAPRLVALLRPLLGTGWTAATGTTELSTSGFPFNPKSTSGFPFNPKSTSGLPSNPKSTSGLVSGPNSNPESLRNAFPPAAARALDGVDRPADLWRAEAALAVRIENDGFSLLRAGLPGPDVVLGAMAVLAADAWRVRAALASAALHAGTSEVLDAVA